MDINEAIDTMAELVVHMLLDDQQAIEALQVGDRLSERSYWARMEFDRHAAITSGLSEEEFARLSEEAGAEGEDPRYSLYYATLTNLNAKVLAIASTKLVNFTQHPPKQENTEVEEANEDAGGEYSYGGRSEPEVEAKEWLDEHGDDKPRYSQLEKPWDQLL
jgi:hypothetical protein